MLRLSCWDHRFDLCINGITTYPYHQVDNRYVLVKLKTILFAAFLKNKKWKREEAENSLDTVSSEQRDLTPQILSCFIILISSFYHFCYNDSNILLYPFHSSLWTESGVPQEISASSKR